MSATETAARHSMDSPEWYTPAVFVEAAREVMGRIDLDPASCEEANQVVNATEYFTEQEDGLKQHWHETVFLNPPGGLVPEFWHKLIFEFERGHTRQAVWIGYSLEQLQTLQCCGARVTPLDFPMCVPKKRIAFIENEAKRALRFEKLLAQGKKPNPKSAPSHANYIAYLGDSRAGIARFADVFGKFGRVRL